MARLRSAMLMDQNTLLRVSSLLIVSLNFFSKDKLVTYNSRAMTGMTKLAVAK